MNILVQPWFSDPAGHPAVSVFGLWQRISKHVKCEVVVHYVPVQNAPHLDEYAARMRAVRTVAYRWMERWLPRQICGSFSTVRALSARENIRQCSVLFHDANIYSLALAVMATRFRPRQAFTFVLSPPEAYRRKGIVGRVKWLLILWLMRRRWLTLCFRTEEMRAAWSVVAPGVLRLLTLPSIEFFGWLPLSHSRSNVPGGRYFVGGQLRFGKCVEELCGVFHGHGAGELVVCGMCVSDSLRRVLARVVGSREVKIMDGFIDTPRFREMLSKSDYNLMLYHPWDDRMEASMVYVAIFSGCPTICFEGGWLGRRVAELGVGWCIPKTSVCDLRKALASLPGPESDEYKAMCDSILRAQKQLANDIIVREYLGHLGWGSSM